MVNALLREPMALSIKTPVKNLRKNLHKLTVIVVMSAVIHQMEFFVDNAYVNLVAKVESGVITRRINLIDDIAIDVASSRDKRARCFTYKNVPESKYVATSLTVGGGRCVWMRAEAIRA
ncbi:hypothetical protein Tco_0551952 [Tanacetum coccineum]